MVKAFCSHCGTQWEIKDRDVVVKGDVCPKCGCNWSAHAIPKEGKKRVQIWVNLIIQDIEGDYFNNGYWKTIEGKD